MDMSRYLVAATFVGVVLASAACTSRTPDAPPDATGSRADRALDTTRDAGADAIAATGHAAQVTADKAQEVAGQVAEKSRDLAAATGVVVTDAWLTTKVKAKFADEVGLKGSDISVDTTDRVVTLTGFVRTPAARARAGAIAMGTEHVARVVNDIVVKEI
jgi:osmotically-inducible protein OsmY